MAIKVAPSTTPIFDRWQGVWGRCEWQFPQCSRGAVDSQLDFSYANDRQIQSGWYLNTCDCCERGSLQPNWSPQMKGDAAAVVALGFDGVKLDSCGPSQDLLQWSRLLNATGTPVLLENCFDNASFPFTATGVDDGTDAIEEAACPMNMFRSGGDSESDSHCWVSCVTLQYFEQ
jgi:hypothetical protein